MRLFTTSKQLGTYDVLLFYYKTLFFNNLETSYLDVIIGSRSYYFRILIGCAVLNSQLPELLFALCDSSY